MGIFVFNSGYFDFINYRSNFGTAFVFQLRCHFLSFSPQTENEGEKIDNRVIYFFVMRTTQSRGLCVVGEADSKPKRASERASDIKVRARCRRRSRSTRRSKRLGWRRPDIRAGRSRSCTKPGRPAAAASAWTRARRCRRRTARRRRTAPSSRSAPAAGRRRRPRRIRRRWSPAFPSSSSFMMSISVHLFNPLLFSSKKKKVPEHGTWAHSTTSCKTVMWWRMLWNRLICITTCLRGGKWKDGNNAVQIDNPFHLHALTEINSHEMENCEQQKQGLRRIRVAFRRLLSALETKKSAERQWPSVTWVSILRNRSVTAMPPAVMAPQPMVVTVVPGSVSRPKMVGILIGPTEPEEKSSGVFNCRKQFQPEID